VDVLRHLLTFIVWLGIAQGFAGLLTVIAFSARAPLSADGLPPVTILKPVCGAEPLLEEALASFCRQYHPTFQVVIGAQDAADPAISVARRVQSRFPAIDIKIVVDPTRHGANGKIGNLMNMLAHAKHDVLVIADSDLHVAPDYLQHLVASLQIPGTGLVTTLPAAEPVSPSIAAALGATWLNHCFLPSALIAAALGRQDCLGGTMTLHRDTLQRIGGLATLVDHLADDNVLGKRVSALGLKLRIAKTVPVLTVPENTLSALWLHELRWARTIGSIAPLSLAGCVLQYPLFWALLALLTSGSLLWNTALFATAWAARVLILHGIDMALAPYRARPVRPTPIWLLPLRDVLSVVEIIASFFGTEVVWRGRTLNAANTEPHRPLAPLPAMTPMLAETLLHDNFAGEAESIVTG
jgi:ceramide glucosyltransferase